MNPRHWHIESNTNSPRYGNSGVGFLFAMH